MEWKSRSILCKNRRNSIQDSYQQGYWQIRDGAFWWEHETYPLERSVIKHRETCRDGTDRTTHYVLIFVINLTVQTTKADDIPAVPKGIDDNCCKHLEENYKNLTTWTSSSRREWSNWMVKAVTHVASWTTWSEEVDEAGMAGLLDCPEEGSKLLFCLEANG